MLLLDDRREPPEGLVAQGVIAEFSKDGLENKLGWVQVTMGLSLAAAAGTAKAAAASRPLKSGADRMVREQESG